jgi:hypothetical protein
LPMVRDQMCKSWISETPSRDSRSCFTSLNTIPLYQLVSAGETGR